MDCSGRKDFELVSFFLFTLLLQGRFLEKTLLIPRVSTLVISLHHNKSPGQELYHVTLPPAKMYMSPYFFTDYVNDQKRYPDFFLFASLKRQVEQFLTCLRSIFSGSTSLYLVCFLLQNVLICLFFFIIFLLQVDKLCQLHKLYTFPNV